MMIWSGPSLPYPAVLSLASALAADPDAEVELHLLGDSQPTPELTQLATDPRCSVHHIDLDRLLTAPVRRLFDAIPPGAHAARSNVLRVALLHRRGGVYLDLDTFLLRPLHGLAPGAFAGLERVWLHDRDRVEGRLLVRHWPATAGWGVAWAAKRADSSLFHGRGRLADRLRFIDGLFHTEQMNNAVIGAPAGSDLTAAMLERAVRCDPTVRYALGPALLHDTLATNPRLATVLPPEVFYEISPGESHRFFQDRTLRLGDSAAVVHYVNSNHRALLASIRPGDDRFHRPEVFWRLARAAEGHLQAATNRVQVAS
jgi:hypothetical protein